MANIVAILDRRTMSRRNSWGKCEGNSPRNSHGRPWRNSLRATFGRVVKFLPLEIEQCQILIESHEIPTNLRLTLPLSGLQQPGASASIQPMCVYGPAERYGTVRPIRRATERASRQFLSLHINRPSLFPTSFLSSDTSQFNSLFPLILPVISRALFPPTAFPEQTDRASSYL
jgi:hypothetical protein